MTAHQTIKSICNHAYQSYRNGLFIAASLLIVGCSQNHDETQLNDIGVEFWYQQQLVNCEQSIELQGTDWQLQNMALFISDIKLSLNSQASLVALRQNDWQNSGVGLLRLTQTNCPDLQTDSASNQRVVTGPIPFASLVFDKPVQLDEASQLSFTLGLPFSLNHLEPLSQPPPLNQPSMFWSWRGGHKFLRLDMQSEHQAWNFHLGSTGCSAASAMNAPQQECLHANRLQFSLPRQQNGHRLIVHLDKLLSGLEFNTKSSCLMQADNRSCSQLMTNLANNDVFEWR